MALVRSYNEHLTLPRLVAGVLQRVSADATPRLRAWGCVMLEIASSGVKSQKVRLSAIAPPPRKVTTMSRKVRIAAAVATLVALMGATGLSSANARADTSWGAPVISLLG